MTHRTAAAVPEHLLRDLAPQVLAAVARRHRDFAAAEDAVQDALIAAAAQWPRDGTPDNPRGWLYQVALRRLADSARSEMSRRKREEDVATERFAEQPANVEREEDDTLVLLFMCCHPSLTPPTSIALTLRAVGGLSTAEIAKAFFVPEATMAQRISRAKQAIKSSGVPFSLPSGSERATRLRTVLQTLYLIFNEGYATSGGASLQRLDLADEAIRLARMTFALLPDDGEITALLALMLLTDARRAARTSAEGDLIPLDEQDRSLWNREAIAEGIALVERAMSRGVPGQYQVQAAIAALHDEAPTAGETDWPQILALYGVLEQVTDNPMVSLNRAIATAMVHGPAAGLALVASLDGDPRMQGHFRLDAVRGHLHEMLGDGAEAAKYYFLASEKTLSVPERDYLRRKAARLKST